MKTNKTNIQKGYSLHITTYEMGGNNYAKKIINGLTLEDVNFLIAISSRFKSHNEFRTCFGNTENNNDSIIQNVNEIKKKHLNVSDNIKKLWNFDNENGEEYILDIINEELIGISSQYGLWRVFEKFEVFEILVPIENVTEKFKQK